MKTNLKTKASLQHPLSTPRAPGADNIRFSKVIIAPPPDRRNARTQRQPAVLASGAKLSLPNGIVLDLGAHMDIETIAQLVAAIGKSVAFV